MNSQKPQAVLCSEPTARPPMASGATLPLSHRHGACSPVPSETKLTLAKVLHRDQLRAELLQWKFSKDHRLQSSEVAVPTMLGPSLEYVISVDFGSPAVKQTLIADTGSDVSWVRCHDGSAYDPSKSTTYTAFSCDAAACTQLGNGCTNSQCQYVVMYGDGSNTTGTYGSDALGLTGSETVPSFQFGCSHAENDFGDTTDDGLMGLGGDSQSLVSQTAATYGNAFSYCLPPTSSTQGFLTLGAPSSSSCFATTEMRRSEHAPTFYGVLLQGISVDGEMLGVSPSVFSAGSFMDSGTIITRLPPTAYSALSSAFKEGMKQYPSAPPSGILDTCFDFAAHDNVTMPSVALVFHGGAVVSLDATGIILDSCLAFTATNDDGVTGIIGNVQQKTFVEVLYYVGQSVLGFRPNAC